MTRSWLYIWAGSFCDGIYLIWLSVNWFDITWCVWTYLVHSFLCFVHFFFGFCPFSFYITFIFAAHDFDWFTAPGLLIAPLLSLLLTILTTDYCASPEKRSRKIQSHVFRNAFFQKMMMVKYVRSVLAYFYITFFPSNILNFTSWWKMLEKMISEKWDILRVGTENSRISEHCGWIFLELFCPGLKSPCGNFELKIDNNFGK